MTKKFDIEKIAEYGTKHSGKSSVNMNIGHIISDSYFGVEEAINKLIDASEYLSKEWSIPEDEQKSCSEIYKYAIYLKEKYY
jgi:hypothetical protein